MPGSNRNKLAMALSAALMTGSAPNDLVHHGWDSSCSRQTVYCLRSALAAQLLIFLIAFAYGLLFCHVEII
jgi:hypothetical protein